MGNIEGWTELAADDPAVVRVLEAVENASTPASQDLADAVYEVAAALGSTDERPPTLGVRPFFPTSRSPELLESAYMGNSERADLEPDLVRLGLQPGLTTKELKAEVVQALQANPILSPLGTRHQIDRSEIVQQLCVLRGLDEAEARRAAETILLWAREFLEVHVQPLDWSLMPGKEFK